MSMITSIQYCTHWRHCLRGYQIDGNSSKQIWKREAKCNGSLVIIRAGLAELRGHRQPLNALPSYPGLLEIASFLLCDQADFRPMVNLSITLISIGVAGGGGGRQIWPPRRFLDRCPPHVSSRLSRPGPVWPSLLLFSSLLFFPFPSLPASCLCWPRWVGRAGAGQGCQG